VRTLLNQGGKAREAEGAPQSAALSATPAIAPASERMGGISRVSAADSRPALDCMADAMWRLAAGEGCQEHWEMLPEDQKAWWRDCARQALRGWQERTLARDRKDNTLAGAAASPGAGSSTREA
jgi:hypothetical protein